MSRILALFGFIALSSSGAAAQQADSLITPNAVLHYSVQGQGQPILFLSGGPGISSEQLAPVSRRLSANYRCILFDQRGTGRSHTDPMDSTTINLRHAMEDITLVLRRLGIEKATIVGHSWGAMLAMSYAINHPRAVASLVLIGSGPLDMPGYALLGDNIMSRASKAEKLFMRSAEDSMAHGTASKALSKAYRKTFFRLLLFDALRVDSLAETTKADMNNMMGNLMLQDLTRNNYDLKSGISGLQMPLLVVCGREDPVGLFSTFGIKELNKNAKISWIEKSGHFPWAEQPERFYATLSDFLK